MDTASGSVKGALTERLRALGVDREHLMEAADKFATLKAENILGSRIWVRGIPAVDQIGISSIVTARFLDDLISIIKESEWLRTIDVFPYGIIAPDVYEVRATFGNVAVQQETLL